MAPPKATANFKPEMGDKEAAGLLMLFSGQQQTRPSAQSTKTSAPTTRRPSPPSKTSPPPRPLLRKTNSHNLAFMDQGLNHVTSPGPAAAALAGGSGQNNNKAIVAAAALAAAAATPLPLLSKKHEGKRKRDAEAAAPKRKVSKSASSRPSYAVDPDSGIISCICGYDHDDGFTIQCDKCFRWQHGVCMGINSVTDAPEKYICYLCDRTHHIDGDKARRIQEGRLGTIKAHREAAAGATSPKSPAAPTPQEHRFALKRYETFYLDVSHYEYHSSSVMALMKRLPKLIAKKQGVMSYSSIDDMSRQLVAQGSVKVVLPDAPGEKFSGASKICLTASRDIAASSLVLPMYGGLELKQDYIEDRANRYWLLGCCKPSAFFHPLLPIVVDERAVGNKTRFVRKSCQANCEIRTAIIGSGSSSTRRCVFVLATTQPVAKGQELTLPWEWDANHPIRKAQTREQYEQLDASAKAKLVNSVLAVTGISGCACTDKEHCVFEVVKRLSSGGSSRASESSTHSHAFYDPIENRYVNRELKLAEAAKNTHINKLDVVVAKSDADTSNSRFVHQSSKSIFDSAVVPAQYRIVKGLLTQEPKAEAASDASSSHASAASPASVPLYTPFPVNAEELSRLTASPEASSAVTAPQERRPKVVKKFSLADYKRKTKGHLAAQ